MRLQLAHALIGLGVALLSQQLAALIVVVEHMLQWGRHTIHSVGMQSLQHFLEAVAEHHHTDACSELALGVRGLEVTQVGIQVDGRQLFCRFALLTTSLALLAVAAAAVPVAVEQLPPPKPICRCEFLTTDEKTTD